MMLLGAFGCGSTPEADRKPAGSSVASPTESAPRPPGRLDAVARRIADRLTGFEAKRDVTCWTSSRQLDWYIASKSYNDLATVAKIEVVKELVRSAWHKASAKASGSELGVTDLDAVLKLPEEAYSDSNQEKLSALATRKGIKDYHSTTEQWRILLSILQDEIYRGGTALKPPDDATLDRLADVTISLSVLLLRRSGEIADQEKVDTIDAPQVREAYQLLAKEYGLGSETSPAAAQPLSAKEVTARLAPLTKANIEGKVKALQTFNKTSGQLLSDLNRITRVPLTDEAAGRLVTDLKSFTHFVSAGYEPMQADNYLSDGSFAPAHLLGKAYLDAIQVDNVTMQMFPHVIENNGDVRVRFEPAPGQVNPNRRAPSEILLIGHEMDAVRDSAVHWMVLDQVWNETPYAMDPFAAEYLSEVVSMMMTLYIRRGEVLAKQMGKKEIDLEVAKKVRDPGYVMVLPRRDRERVWGKADEARKAKVLAAYRGGLFRDVTARAGLLTKMPSFDDGLSGATEKSHGDVQANVKSHGDVQANVKSHGDVQANVKSHGDVQANVKSHGDVQANVKSHGDVQANVKSHGDVQANVKSHGDVQVNSHGDQRSLAAIQGLFDIQKVMGSGIAVGDLNNDGYPDLFVGGEGLSRLFLNRGKSAPGKFEDVTQAWNLPAGLDDCRSALFFDQDGDGDLDLLLIRSDAPFAPLPSRRGRFTDATSAVGLATHRGAHAATVFDSDGDGDLDIYVGYYGADAVNRSGSKERNLPSLDGRNGSPNELWRLGPDGRYTEAAKAAGVADVGWALAASTFDYDRDGDLDLFLANDFGPDVLYQNKGDGTFGDVSERTGTNDRGSGMNASFTDVERRRLLGSLRHQHRHVLEEHQDRLADGQLEGALRSRPCSRRSSTSRATSSTSTRETRPA